MEIERLGRYPSYLRRRIINNERRCPQRLNAWGVIFLLYSVFFLALVYVVVVEIVYHRGRLSIEDVDIDQFRVNYTFSNTTTVALGGNSTLEVFFKTSGHVERSFGDFTISSIAFPNNPIKSFSQHTIIKQDGKKDVVVVRFDTHPTTLTAEQLRVFKESLANGGFGIKLSVEYAWNVKQEVYFMIPPPVKYARFTCQIPYKAVRATKSHPTRCVKN